MMNKSEIKLLAIGKGWVVIDKPNGISVHNEPGYDLVSLVTRIIGQDPILSQELHYNASDKISPAHRLDRDTT